MARLEEAHKTYVVQQLACFRSPSEVCDLVKEEFGIEIDRQQVRNYNPLQVEVAAKWQALFDATRKKFLETQAEIGIAQQSYRLQELQEWYWWAKRKKNAGLAREILEQAAKESGGGFTNRRELTGKDGKELPAPTVNVIIDDGSTTSPKAG